MDAEEYFAEPPPWLLPADIVDPVALARRLLAPTDPLTRCIASTLNDEEARALGAGFRLPELLAAVINRAMGSLDLISVSRPELRTDKVLQLFARCDDEGRARQSRWQEIDPGFATELRQPDRPQLGQPGVESDWLRLGEFDLVSGRMIAVDVRAGSPDDSPVIDLPPGRYRAECQGVAYGASRWVSRLRAVREGGEGERGAEIGEAWADAANIGLADVEPFSVFSAALLAAEWDDPIYRPFNSGNTVRMLHLDPPGGAWMPLVQSGWGDGTFPVYELVDGGERVGVEVEFIRHAMPYPWRE